MDLETVAAGHLADTIRAQATGLRELAQRLDHLAGRVEAEGGPYHQHAAEVVNTVTSGVANLAMGQLFYLAATADQARPAATADQARPVAVLTVGVDGGLTADSTVTVDGRTQQVPTRTERAGGFATPRVYEALAELGYKPATGADQWGRPAPGIMTIPVAQVSG